MLLKIIACMFLMREYYWNSVKDYARACAYKTAYHLVAYAIHDREDCIGEFDNYEDAAQFVHEHPYMDIWYYEDKVKECLDEQKDDEKNW